MNDLATLLKVRDTLNKKCSLIPTPSSSVMIVKGKTIVQNHKSCDASFNEGLIKSSNVVMDMIEEIAKFVSVCCGVKIIVKSKIIEKRANGGTYKTYIICTKCKKECESEWRLK